MATADSSNRNKSFLKENRCKIEQNETYPFRPSVWTKLKHCNTRRMESCYERLIILFS